MEHNVRDAASSVVSGHISWSEGSAGVGHSSAILNIRGKHARMRAHPLNFLSGSSCPTRCGKWDLLRANPRPHKEDIIDSSCIIDKQSSPIPIEYMGQ